MAVSEKSVVADSTESSWEDVQEEATEEIGGIEPEDFLLPAVRVVAPPEVHDVVMSAEQPVVGQGDAVGIAGEVVENMTRAAEGFLGVDDPVLIAQVGRSAVGSTAKGGEELPAEDAGEGSDGEQVTPRPADPAPARRIESSGGDDAMQMDVEREILSPGVEHGDDARLGSEVARVARELEEGGAGGLKQRAVHESGALKC